MHTTAIPILCQHCGRPIGGATVVIGGYSYHPECTHGPSYPTTYQLSATALTEADVRRIVREEMSKSAALPIDLENICAKLPAHAAMAVRRAWGSR